MAIENSNNNNTTPALNLGVMEEQSLGSLHHIHMPTVIDDETEADILIICTKLRTLSPSDQVYLYVGGQGGRIDLLIKLVNSLKACPAIVTMVVDAPVYSAHAMLACSHTPLVIEKHVSYMFHNLSLGMYGKQNELSSQLKFEEPFYKEFFKNLLLPGALTDAELTAILKGEDKYITGEVMGKRLVAAAKKLRKSRRGTTNE